jgi:hypothetical protein
MPRRNSSAPQSEGSSCAKISPLITLTVARSVLAAWKSNVDCSHMMIDDDTLKQLLRINDALFRLCKSLTDKRGIETSSLALSHLWTTWLTF